MADRPTVLVVDDDPGVRETIADYLALHGMGVESLDGGPALRAWVTGGAPFQVALLDVTMPGEDGLSLARWLRATSRAGIIMVTARDEPLDRIIGLEIGADDYITKPVDLRELLARLRAVLRRIQEPRVPEAADPGRLIEAGGLRINLDARQVQRADGQPVPLTTMEFDLLQVLAQRADKVLTREALLQLSHKDPEAPFDRSIDIRIARLRQKIERDPARPSIIKTVRGVGYVMVRKPD